MGHPIKKPELLAPAGSLEKTKFALAYGADAIYAGLPTFSLRTRENVFDLNELAAAIKYTHQEGKKIYITANIYAHNVLIEPFLLAMNEAAPLGADGYIMSDPGLISLVRERHPDLAIHLSTQANNTNWAQVKFWKNQGIKRIILARELSLTEIKEIVDKNLGLELECFVHGSMCMSYSGRCLLSDYLARRPSNAGQCAHTCRWKFKVRPGLQQNLTDYEVPQESLLLSEDNRPEESYLVEEDRYGTYFSNSKDLCAINILPEIIDTGINSIKIEGRNKSLYYLAIATKIYRRAIDAYFQGDFPEQLAGFREELGTVNQRGYTLGFFHGLAADTINYHDQKFNTKNYAGRILRDLGDNFYELEAKQVLYPGDEVEWITPQETIKHKIDKIYNQEREEVPMASGGHLWNPLVRLAANPGKFALMRKKVQ